MFVYVWLCRREPDFSSICAAFGCASFMKSGAICRVARQNLPRPGKNCPARTAARQLSPGRIFRVASKSMFKQI
jgi:hypothetical protein